MEGQLPYSQKPDTGFYLEARGAVNNLTLYSFKIHFNIILKFKSVSPPPPNVTVEHSCFILRRSRPRYQLS
jgi:hypothetical protein